MQNLNYIFSFPGLLSAKDLHSNYIAVSPNLAKIVGWANAENAVGKNDFDLNCSAVHLAENMIELDKRTYQLGKTMTSLETHQYQSGWKSLLVERNIIIDEKSKTACIVTHGVDVTHTALANHSISLSQLDRKLSNQPSIYILTDHYFPIQLTENQKMCLFLLMRGKTNKVIATILGASKKTIENDITIIKEKMQCTSQSELIEKAIEHGFLFYIPQSFLNSKFNDHLTTKTLNHPLADKLSTREQECIDYYLKGHTAKETAALLGLSYRTIEEYFTNIKKKLHCQSKRDLIHLFS